MPRDASSSGPPAGSTKVPLLPGALTEAGRTAEFHAHMRRSLEADNLTAAEALRPAAIGPQAKPSKARARAAREQALVGLSLARKRQHAEAISAFKRSVALDPTVAAVLYDLGFACLEADRAQEAADALAAALRLQPDFPNASNNLAIALDRLGRKVEALRLYEEGVRWEPGWHAAQLRLGRIYRAAGRSEEAAAAFRAAAAATDDPIEAEIDLAFAAAAGGDCATAEAKLRAAIRAAPDSGFAFRALGEILGESGRLSEAAAALEHAITLRPEMVDAWWQFATNNKFTTADRTLIGRIAASLGRPDLTQEERKAVHFTLGKANDDIGDYAEAMRHFVAGNRIRAATLVLDRATLMRWTSEMIAATPTGYLARRSDLGVADETPILIVGMPRSGTTLVEQILSRHQEIAAGGELEFWSERNRAGARVFDADAKPEAVRRLAEDYLRVLRGIAPEAARVTDKMPLNFLLLGLIRQVFPRATIVHCRRHPLDTCLSIFCTHFENPIHFAADRGSLVFFYRQYQRMMAHWRAVLPEDRFIEVEYEQLVADPEPTTRRLIETCGLAWDEACLTPHLSDRRVTTASLWQVRQPIYRTSVGRWKHYEPWLGELSALLGDAEGAAAEAGRG
ncbi:MAG: tetratricopeptide repeat-containing sulfotransferase family protein [Acetobacteraceae bacterium]